MLVTLTLHQRVVIIFALVTILFWGCNAASAQTSTLSFNAQTSWVTLQFDGMDGQSAAVAGRDAQGRAKLAIVHVSDAKLVITESELPQDAVAIDAGATGDDADALFVLTPSHALRIDGINTPAKRVVAASSIYKGRSYSALTGALDFARDIDGDGIAELVIPGFDALSVYDGVTYAASGTPMLPSVRRSYENAVTYRPARYAIARGTRASGIQLLAMRGNDLHQFAADTNGFSAAPVVTPLALGLASERDVEVFYNGDDDIDQSNVVLREAELLKDINSDGLPDLVTLETRSSGVFDKTSTYRVHYAQSGSRGVTFNASADTTLTSNGYQFGFEVVPLSETRNAIVSPSAKIGLRSIISALFSKSVTLRISIHAPDSEGMIPDEPNTEVKAKIRFDFGSGQVQTPTVEFADLNGDGKNDLVLKSRANMLAWRQNLGDGRFASKDKKLDLVAPANGENVGVADFNGDGRDDLIARYSKGDGEALKGTVRWISTLAPQ
ncbi:MAG: VCBS repeat-containing protein [Pseudomonadota bacterium]